LDFASFVQFFTHPSPDTSDPVKQPLKNEALVMPSDNRTGFSIPEQLMLF
jgi:hypothetical protein